MADPEAEAVIGKDDGSDIFDNMNQHLIWKERFEKCQQKCREMRRKNIEQAKKARQLIAAVGQKLQEKEWQFNELQLTKEEELSKLGRQIIQLQANLAKEQSRIVEIIASKDKFILELRQKLDNQRQDSRTKCFGKRQLCSSRQYKLNSTINTDSLAKIKINSANEIEKDAINAKPSHAPLRLSLSADPPSTRSLSLPRKGILKRSDPVKFTSTSNIMAPMQHPIIHNQSKQADETTVANSSRNLVISHKHNNSISSNDSGRESDDTLEYARTSVKQSMEKKTKTKPAPPPRSDTTRLTSSKENEKPSAPQRLQDQNIKFQIARNAIQLLENSIKNYKPLISLDNNKSV